MLIFIRGLAGLFLTVLLASCGGGDSTTSNLRCANVDCKTLSDPVSTNFVPVENNLRVTVDDLGPHSFSGNGSPINTNMLYATVTVCALNGVPSDTSQCTNIDHVLVDTGSVGLRVLASKVNFLGLTPVPLASGNAWECFPFVIGGLWGRNVEADVYLGKQKAAVRMQLIDDQAALKPPNDCINVTDNSLLKSADALGANGILGIGNTIMDCGADCVGDIGHPNGHYSVNSLDGFGSSVLYYDCPHDVTDSAQCHLASVPVNFQVSNPISALPEPFNNGFILKMPAIPDTQPGAATAAGELILGIDIVNMPIAAKNGKIFLGVIDTSSPSYLGINTYFRNHNYANSYLDTGTNGVFFYDKLIKPCASVSEAYFWYCPDTTLKDLKATLSDGDPGRPSGVDVTFQVANFSVLSFTDNTAFSSAAGAVNQKLGNAYVPDTQTFAWGMPFFYGKTVYLSIWQQPGSEAGPWYAWTVP